LTVALPVLNARFAMIVLTAVLGLLGWGIVASTNHQQETTS
jgi:hypothetical protein